MRVRENKTDRLPRELEFFAVLCNRHCARPLLCWNVVWRVHGRLARNNLLQRDSQPRVPKEGAHLHARRQVQGYKSKHKARHKQRHRRGHTANPSGPAGFAVPCEDNTLFFGLVKWQRYIPLTSSYTMPAMMALMSGGERGAHSNTVAQSHRDTVGCQ